MVCWEGYAEWRTPLGRGDRWTNCGWKRDGNQQLLALWEPFLVLRSVPWRIGPRNLAIYLSSLHGQISTLSKGSLPPATRYLVLVCPIQISGRSAWVPLSFPGFHFTCEHVEVERWALSSSLTYLSRKEWRTHINLLSILELGFRWFGASFWNWRFVFPCIPSPSTLVSLLHKFSIRRIYTSISHFTALWIHSRTCAPWHHRHFDWALEVARRPAGSWMSPHRNCDQYLQWEDDTLRCVVVGLVISYVSTYRRLSFYLPLVLTFYFCLTLSASSYQVPMHRGQGSYTVGIRGHSCIGNSGAVFRRSFTAAIPTQRPLKLSTRIAFVLCYFPSDAHLFLLVYLSFNFQNCCTKEDNGDDGS